MRIGRSVDVRVPVIIASVFLRCEVGDGLGGAFEFEIVSLHSVIEVDFQALLSTVSNCLTDWLILSVSPFMDVNGWNRFFKICHIEANNMLTFYKSLSSFC